MKNILLFILTIVGVFSSVFAQQSKDGLKIISGTEIVNEYTHLTSDGISGFTSINVVSSSLNSNGRFSGGLVKGDLLFIIQMQGVTIQTADTGDFSWGEVLDYNNCGLYEYVEVDNVTNGTTIELSCPLRNDYTALGKVNVIRVPRYSELNIPLNQTLTGKTWDGASGGLVVVEVSGDAIINGEVDINAKGFRGTDGSNNVGGGSYAFEFATTVADIGALKGEGVAGYHADYDTLGGRYGKGAAANAGGGGLSLNAGGGGGSNIGDVSSYYGWGVPDKSSNPNYASAWALEGTKIGVEIASKNSSGGGRGGYTLSENLEDPLALPIWETAWGGDERRASASGLGGRPLDGGTSRVFLGGGGGQGHGGSWDNEFNSGDGLGGAGGYGGGVVMLKVFGDLNGDGTINANGEDGKGGENTSTSSFYGAGGAGAGGTVVLEVAGELSSLKIHAKGGNGGTITNEDISEVNRLTGPGGGGAGGVVKTSVALDSINVSAGANGTMVGFGILKDKFEPNGATFGAIGISTVEAFVVQELTAQNDSVCIGDNALLTVLGQSINGSSVYWFDAQFGGNQIGTGLTFPILNIQSDSTVYAGVCPGENRISVTAKAVDKSDFSIVDNSQKIICSGTSVDITAKGTDYVWYPNKFINDTTASTVSITPLVTYSEFDTLKYYVQISEGSCFVLDSVTVVGVRKPFVRVPSALGTAHGCLGSIKNLSTSHDFGSGEKVTYIWDDGKYTGAEVDILLTENKKMKITAIDDVYNCRDSNTFDIKVSVVESEFSYADTCFGDSTMFTSKATSTIGEISSSEWFINGVEMSGSDWSSESGIRKFNPATAYSVTHININDLNCSDTLTKQITIRDLPNQPISLGLTNTCVDQEVSFSSSYSNSEGSVLMWDLGNSESSSADSGTTTYSSTGYKTIELAITDRHNCSNTIIGKVNVIDGPQANFVLPDSVTYGDEITVDLSGVSGGANFYWLSDNDTLSTSLLPKIIGDKAGEICYTLTVISPIGCVITNEECVIVEGKPLKLPNLFTPNGDGYNDELEVLNSDGKVVSIVIYNRWGELVFQEENYQNDWSGLSRSGRSLSTGTYFVVMKNESKVDSEPVNGFVHLTK